MLDKNQENLDIGLDDENHTNNIRTNTMPAIPYDKPPKWEHGTAKEVTKILQDKGQTISYDAVCKRLARLSDYETVKLAVQVSKRRRESRRARNENMRRLIKLAKQESES